MTAKRFLNDDDKNELQTGIESAKKVASDASRVAQDAATIAHEAYSPTNKPTASDVGALPIDGSVPISGDDLYLNNGYGRMFSSDGGFRIDTLNAIMVVTNRRGLWLANSSNSELVNAVALYDTINNTNKKYKIFGEHNVTCGTSDITAGTTALATGCYYDVYK